MSISSVASNPWSPTASAVTAAPSAAVPDAATSPTASVAQSAQELVSGSGNLVGQLSSDIQSFLLHLQGNGTGPASGATPGASGPQLASTQSGVNAIGSKHVGHHGGHHGASGVGKTGETNADGSAATPVNADAPTGAANPSSDPTTTDSFARSLAADVAKALRSYGSSIAQPLTTAAQTAGLAAAA